MVVVVMGVSGCGKTTIASSLAQALGWTFIEGDALHPPENVQRMAQGIALTDADRALWLERLALELKDQSRVNAGVVMGLLPTKGLTLPFLSYGGSSLVALCFMFGLLLNIEKQDAEENEFSGGLRRQSPFLQRQTKLSSVK